MTEDATWVVMTAHDGVTPGLGALEPGTSPPTPHLPPPCFLALQLYSIHRSFSPSPALSCPWDWTCSSCVPDKHSLTELHTQPFVYVSLVISDRPWELVLRSPSQLGLLVGSRARSFHGHFASWGPHLLMTEASTGFFFHTLTCQLVLVPILKLQILFYMKIFQQENMTS